MGKSKAHQRYKTKDGCIVPGVTTITGILDKPALVYWAWDLGMKGIDYKKFKDDKADIGTLAHDMIICHLLGTTPNLDDYTKNQISQAENALISFFEWEKGKNIEVRQTEKALVSEQFKYGGQFDVFATIDGISTLLDIKTGKAIYPEMVIQLAAYANLIDEDTNNVLQSVKILRVGRDETEGFDVRDFTDKMVPAWEIFAHLLQVYKLRKEL
jgi:hypothetical protein